MEMLEGLLTARRSKSERERKEERPDGNAGRSAHSGERSRDRAREHYPHAQHLRPSFKCAFDPAVQYLINELPRYRIAPLRIHCLLIPGTQTQRYHFAIPSRRKRASLGDLVRWCEFAREKAQLRMTACRLASEGRRAWSRSVMAMWRLHCRLKTHFRASLRFMKQRSNGLKKNSFSRWCRNTTSQQKHGTCRSMALHLLQRALKPKHQNMLSAALLSWSAATYESKVLRNRQREGGRRERERDTRQKCKHVSKGTSSRWIR